MNPIVTLAAISSLLLLFPIFIGILLLLKGFAFRKRLTPSLKRLVLFNTLIYSIFLVAAVIDKHALLGFFVLSFLMLPTYFILLWGKMAPKKKVVIKPTVEYTDADRTKAKVKLRAMLNFRAKMVAQKKAEGNL